MKALRAVALLEFLKGVAVLLLGFGVLSMLHHDAWVVAGDFLDFLHVNPGARFAQVFLDLADRLNDVHLWQIAVVGATYCTLRLVEAFGLWKARAWAEWLAFASGAIYLPFELYELARKATPIRAAILSINVVIVLYMLYLRTWGRAQHAPEYQAGD